MISVHCFQFNQPTFVDYLTCTGFAKNGKGSHAGSIRALFSPSHQAVLRVASCLVENKHKFIPTASREFLPPPSRHKKKKQEETVSHTRSRSGFGPVFWCASRIMWHQLEYAPAPKRQPLAKSARAWCKNRGIEGTAAADTVTIITCKASARARLIRWNPSCLSTGNIRTSARRGGGRFGTRPN